jgi:hypothetical protein
MVRYFFHILTDKMRLRDDDGQEYLRLDDARAEATQAARDLMAEELRCGRPVPVGWQVQIAIEDGTILSTLSFQQIAFPHSSGLAREALADRALIARAKATQKTRRTKDEISQGLQELRHSIRQLARINSSVPTGRGA